jgi:hypothetical protein
MYITNLMQKAFSFTNLLSLPYFLPMKTKSNKPLINYLHSHVVTSTKYLVALKQKTMENKVVKKN